MDVLFTEDLPPVPECFSKFLESEMGSLPNDQPWREAERLRELKEVILKSLDEKSVSKTMMNGESKGKAAETTLLTNNNSVRIKNDGSYEGSDESDNENKTFIQSPENHQNEIRAESNSSSSHRNRLNTSLSKLKRAMVDLRTLDMSLFCQLLSLNEAIQDFKMSVTDRYSDYTGSEYTCSEYAGSEYSFSMGSRTGSFSSLNDENVWGGDFRGVAAQECSNADELAVSTSSLLQQINALTQRAENDF